MGYDLNGLGMAVPALKHKEITRNILINFYLQFGFINYEAYQEAAADESDRNSLVPDIVIFPKISNIPIVVVEVERNVRRSEMAYKVERYIDEYKVSEIFYYDYKKKIWTKYTNKYEEITSKSSIIKGLDFEPMIYLDRVKP